MLPHTANEQKRRKAAGDHCTPRRRREANTAKWDADFDWKLRRQQTCRSASSIRKLEDVFLHKENALIKTVTLYAASWNEAEWRWTKRIGTETQHNISTEWGTGLPGSWQRDISPWWQGQKPLSMHCTLQEQQRLMQGGRSAAKTLFTTDENPLKPLPWLNRLDL